jgi:hypothetical protein
LHGLGCALDRDFVEEDGVGFSRQVRRDDGQKGAEAVLLVREGIDEGLTCGPRLRPDNQVDMRHLVAITDQRLTDVEICSH